MGGRIFGSSVRVTSAVTMAPCSARWATGPEVTAWTLMATVAEVAATQVSTARRVFRHSRVYPEAVGWIRML
ncbi:hypothetical protein GCM10009560_32690 [Nonomuraea longicatena]|uniref:Secreted protein n=1 Tax=Nonomuraea longicatena TaxID=83682 RepID=A0ABN1PJF8_9ACTN